MPAFLLALAAAAAAAQEPSSPRLLNLEELVTADDYPRVALVNDQEGRVTVRLRIDRSGLVKSCKVAVSSGHQSLDEQTCAVYRARARFEPARDRRGRTVESSYTQTVTWRLADHPAVPTMPRHAWMTRTTAAVSSGGAIIDCKVEATGVGSQPPFCDILKAMVASHSGTIEAKGPIASFSISETYFYPVEAKTAASPPKLRDADKIGEQVSQIVIEADGTVSTCEGMRYSGFASPDRDFCGMLLLARFDAAPPGTPSLTGTVVMTAYVRKHVVT